MKLYLYLVNNADMGILKYGCAEHTSDVSRKNGLKFEADWALQGKAYAFVLKAHLSAAGRGASPVPHRIKSIQAQPGGGAGQVPHSTKSI